jgi:hypothetical protein
VCVLLNPLGPGAAGGRGGANPPPQQTRPARGRARGPIS